MQCRVRRILALVLVDFASIAVSVIPKLPVVVRYSLNFPITALPLVDVYSNLSVRPKN
jgi:hypothetical protein